MKFYLLNVMALVVLLGCSSRPGRLRAAEPFLWLQPGMTMQEVTNKVGAPDRHAGSGVFRWEYDLADGSTIMVFPGPGDPQNPYQFQDFTSSKVARIVQRRGTNWLWDTQAESRQEKQ
jgi:hypothetical protein